MIFIRIIDGPPLTLTNYPPILNQASRSTDAAGFGSIKNLTLTNGALTGPNALSSSDGLPSQLIYLLSINKIFKEDYSDVINNIFK